ncbi:MAG: PAS domain S-box protein [Methanoregula sp.]|nr:MAG: PAS domain S-box protein [Methanoregula sp.]
MVSHKNKNTNVLVVEDSPTQAEHLKLILEKAGYEVSIAGNGKEALLLLETTLSKLVISDIVMPEMDGYELCRRIKGDERFKEIPVILVTVLYDPADVIRGLECGANNFISKPYDEKYLLSRIEIVLASSYAEETEKFQIGLEISFAGKKHHIAASRLQILNMLLSTYETAVQKNQELTEARDQLRELNEHLEDLVAERTLQLENTNRQLLEEIEVRKKTEEALQRKTRAYHVISECNQFLVRTSDLQDLIKGICKILVTLGGYRCAWVGYAHHDKDKTVEVVAQFGFEEEYLKNLRISWKKGHHGKGPTGTAIMTGKPTVVHNIQNNPKCGRWIYEAIKRDYSTVAAFPLIIQEQVIGALTIYAIEPEAFDSDEMQLLSEMAGDLAFGIASIRTTIERNEAEEALHETNEYLSNLFNYANAPIITWDTEFRITRFNHAFEHLTGRSQEEMLGKTLGLLFPDKGRKAAMALIQKTLEGERWEAVEIPILTAEGGTRTVLWNSANVLDVHGNLTATIAQGIDITERKKAEDALRDSQQILEKILNNIPVRVFWKDKNLTYLGCNIPFARDAGFEKPEDVIGKDDYVMVWRDQAELYRADDRTVIETGRPKLMIEESQTTPAGETIHLLTSKVPLSDNQGKNIGVLGTYYDITERKLMEDEIRSLNTVLEQRVAERTESLNKTLHEKDILFKEVHHRVKNNMQIIISLLNLQSRTIDDPVILKTIKDSQSRIRAMALVHERLYQSGDISKIDLRDYIQFLARELFSFYGVKSQLIHLTINAPVIMVNIDTAIPLGLMVNELISNAIKYAFPDDRKGEIVIDITKDKNEISLVVRDNGVGIPQDFDWHNAKSLGIRLVNSLVEQLQGTIELDRTAGTKFIIMVKEKA